ncbi:MAG TPA: HWE histidine kinase domain-containing protein [Steroidobacteraceae bacterium]|nr:HWE histidine kinase domain-containing protein [Steroidobacteraceae bacterium]
MSVFGAWTSFVPLHRVEPRRAVLIAAGSLALAVLLRLPFETWLAGGIPYATFFPAILIAALFGGRWAGLLTLLAGGPLALWLFGADTQARPVASVALWLTNGGLILLLTLGVRRLMIAVHRREVELGLAREQLRSVVDELKHRARNTFTVVMALAHQTSRDADSVQEYRERLTERLTALGRAHDVLTGERWERVELASVLESALQPFRSPPEDNIELGPGPRCEVGSAVGIALTLILHELATNALKYGALSQPGGVVRCDWIADEQEVRLHWRECGGPRVEPPSHRGLGTRLIQQALAADPRGAADLRFEPAGVECELRFSRVDGASVRRSGGAMAAV